MGVERNEVKICPITARPVVTTPKPPDLYGRVGIQVSDEVVLSRDSQPLIDAYATAMGRVEWIGKDLRWIEVNAGMRLTFHIIEFDDPDKDPATKLRRKLEGESRVTLLAYGMDKLSEFCREARIAYSGTKAEMTNRLLEWRAGGKEA